MAPCGLPFVLALELATSWWPANSSAGNTQTGPRDEHRQPTVGSATDPWRAAQARHRDRTDKRGQIYGRKPDQRRQTRTTIMEKQRATCSDAGRTPSVIC